MVSCADVGAEIGDEYGDVRPLTANLQKVLRTNYAQLVKLINSSTSRLVSQLSRVGVISGQHHHHLLYIIIIIINSLLLFSPRDGKVR